MNEQQNLTNLPQQTYTAKGPRRSTIDILKRLREGQLQATDINTYERRVCVAYLRLEGYTQDEIAEIFGVCQRTVARDENSNRKNLAKLVNNIDVKAIAGGLITWAKHLTAKAIKEKDYGLAWRVQRELVADLQSLGYLPKAAEKHAVQVGTFVDLARLAIEQPLDEPHGLPDVQQPQLSSESKDQDNGDESEED